MLSERVGASLAVERCFTLQVLSSTRVFSLSSVLEQDSSFSFSELAATQDTLQTQGSYKHHAIIINIIFISSKP